MKRPQLKPGEIVTDGQIRGTVIKSVIHQEYNCPTREEVYVNWGSGVSVLIPHDFSKDEDE